jgi:hypothetical protein
VRCCAGVATPRPGDLLSIHWDVACDLLTAPAALRLDALTRRTLAAVNTSASTAAALA